MTLTPQQQFNRDIALSVRTLAQAVQQAGFNYDPSLETSKNDTAKIARILNTLLDDLGKITIP